MLRCIRTYANRGLRASWLSEISVSLILPLLNGLEPLTTRLGMTIGTPSLVLTAVFIDIKYHYVEQLHTVRREFSKTRIFSQTRLIFYFLSNNTSIAAETFAKIQGRTFPGVIIGIADL